jgi:glucosamine kinase
MVQVIGEIGGSSSRWAVLLSDGTVHTWPVKGERWPGFNPLSGDGAAFSAALHDLLTTVHPEALAAVAIHIYGAGCGSEERRVRMRAAIAGVWPDAAIQVESDLMGAALGLCGKKAGLVLILGTGMNAGHFDGERLHCPMPSLGYLLGDEASGADIGRHFLQDAYYRRIPEDVSRRIFGEAPPALSMVLARIHQASHPARELAAFTALLAPRLHEPYVRDLIQGRFHALAELLTGFFRPEQITEVYATGSVAFGFRELLTDTLLDRGMTLNVVEPDPLLGLVVHHRQRGL